MSFFTFNKLALLLITVLCLILFFQYTQRLEPKETKKVYWEKNLDKNCYNKSICQNISKEFSEYRWNIFEESKNPNNKFNQIFEDYCYQASPELDKSKYTVTSKVKVRPEELHCMFYPISNI
jgi:hypothetical protein